MRLLLDEMLSPRVAAQLRRRGHDVVAVSDRSDLLGRSDDRVFDAAQEERRVIVTEDVGDYRRLAAQRLGRGEEHHGLVLISRRRYPRAEPRTVGRLVRALEELAETRGGEGALRGLEHWL